MEQPLHDESGVPLQPEDSPFFVVGIGASAGGLEALEQFFANTNPTSGIAYVVVQHLSPTHKSHMVELLSRRTKMTVQHATQDTHVVPDTVYLIPPKKNISIQDGVLKLQERDRSTMPSYPIDLFFESLAKNFKERSIGIILSGTGSDGTRGLREIKEAGGVALVQDPDSAQFDGMPRSAISTLQVDHIAIPEKLPEVLVSYAENPLLRREDNILTTPTSASDSITSILQIIQHYSGVDFRLYKPNTIQRRIEHRMGLKQIYDAEQYYRYLTKHEDEVKRLYREMLIGVTRFFRDKRVFEKIEDTVVPQLFRNAIENGHSTIRCWVAGCSSGEEAYSLAMLLHEEQRRQDQHIEIKIFATDIDPDAIVTASSGLYSGSVVADLKQERLNQYFLRKDDHYQIARELRQMIIFAPHNILKDIPFSKVDLISCRNLLIYFSPSTQQTVISNFTYALKPGGFLVLGSSEHISGQENLYKTIDNKLKIFQNKNTNPNLLSSDLFVRDKTTWSTNMGSEIIPNRPNSSALSDHLKEALANYMPASVVVNTNYNVLYFFGDTNSFLKLPVGIANLNLPKIVPPTVRTILGTALHKAFKTGQKVKYSGLSASIDDEDPVVFDLLVDPLKVGDSYETALVVFQADNQQISEDQQGIKYDIEEETQNRIHDLERKLEYTEESLQAAIEELETSNEELQATNEELIASNEELQSTNEELQSTNEELTTVNAELQKKVTELTEINTDMDYLLDSTELCTIFLDENLCVRKFTQPATAYFYLQASDIGRPIYHFTHSFEEADFRIIAQNVLSTGLAHEEDLLEATGRKFILRATPYSTLDGQPRGVVLMFIDISELQTGGNNELTRKLNVQAEQLKAVQKKQSDLFYLASHELKTPLRSLRLTVEKLQQDFRQGLPPEKQKVFEGIYTNVNHLNDTIDDLMTYAHIGRYLEKESIVDLTTLMSELQHKIKLPETKEFIVAKTLPTINTHKQELELVLYNLISSSVTLSKSDSGSISIAAKSHPASTTFTITDMVPTSKHVDSNQENEGRMGEIRYPLNQGSEEHKTRNLHLVMAQKAIEDRGGTLRIEAPKKGRDVITFEWPAVLIKTEP